MNNHKNTPGPMKNQPGTFENLSKRTWNHEQTILNRENHENQPRVVQGDYE